MYSIKIELFSYICTKIAQNSGDKKKKFLGLRKRCQSLFVRFSVTGRFVKKVTKIAQISHKIVQISPKIVQISPKIAQISPKMEP
jgi:hypothetical protein